MRGRALALVVAIAAMSGVFVAAASAGERSAQDFGSYEWTEIYDGGGSDWEGRAGLQAVGLRNRLYVMGGRTPEPSMVNPFASKLWDDVWESRDNGSTWELTAAGPGAGGSDALWPARGYFQAVTKGGTMYVMGGQNLPASCPPGPPLCSEFFNDVWASRDGSNWVQKTASAPWTGRAGLSAIVFKGWIYVLGGSSGDDVAIGGLGRVLFNDVWRSRDGASWEQVTDDAPWAPRAGAAVVEKNGYIYLLGGEDGFLCDFGPGGLDCPYFNDVWRTKDGADWELVTAAADWTARPGHQCQVLQDTIVCFGGFGFPVGDPTVPAHPRDVWTSRDGAVWQQVSDSPWNADGSEDVKYDFDSLVVKGGPGGLRPSILTFGGDREASFAAPDPLLVDADVWRFSPPA